MDATRLLKEKKFWIASFIVVWAAALQGHMMWMQKQDAFQKKFGNQIENHEEEDLSAS
ncbi:uncharacterized protein LOC110028111 [Phalaenopsis equestris]|uniref:uncharacterized protein LOC110028111 n=1 Tax=Phalaenopsis equestris TaxID=78828 RepID=UPI0009E24BFB|nr:uncharacterized protein LOC110028111 [Phalaenopsis equestris]